MGKISQANCYYCSVAYVESIEKTQDRTKIHINPNIEYTFVYELTRSSDTVYYDVRTSKIIKYLDKENVKANNWYIMSAIKIHVDLKGISNYELRRLINYLPRLENKVKVLEIKKDTK